MCKLFKFILLLCAVVHCQQSFAFLYFKSTVEVAPSSTGYGKVYFEDNQSTFSGTTLFTTYSGCIQLYATPAEGYFLDSISEKKDSAFVFDKDCHQILFDVTYGSKENPATFDFLAYFKKDTCSHVYDKGFCIHCGKYQPASLNDNNTPSDATDDYYEIGNAGQLYWFAQKVNRGARDANAVLTADILVNDTASWKFWDDGAKDSLRAWKPIGKRLITGDGNKGFSFKGSFNGNGHTIAGLYLSSNNQYVGLFGSSCDSAKIEKVGVIASYFKGDSYVGGICGYSDSSYIRYCYNIGSVLADSQYVGGVCGYNTGDLSNSYGSGTVSCGGDTSKVGGVCGFNKGNLYNCYSSCSVSSSAQRACVGGVCGSNAGNLLNTYCTGSVSASGQGVCVGGVCGKNTGNLYICYSIVSVPKESNFGSVCGINSGNLGNCMCLAGLEFCGSGDADNSSYTTFERLREGNAACLLQRWVNLKKDDYLTNNQIALADWGQSLGKDALPLFSSKKVYLFTNCKKMSAYTNDSQLDGQTLGTHVYDNGFCVYCKHFEPATDQNHDGIYEIANAGQLYWFAGLVNGNAAVCSGDVKKNSSANAILTDSILVNDTTKWIAWDDAAKDTLLAWTPIGTNSNMYLGSFNGNGNTVAGLYCNVDDNWVGLFGYISKNDSMTATIENVGVVASYFKANDIIGGVCAESDGTINNCYFSGLVDGGAAVAGVCGSNSGTVSNCYNSGTVVAMTSVGGVCGSNQNPALIVNSYSTGSVSATSENGIVGGVCGNNLATINNCYTWGPIKGPAYAVGGYCGRNNGGTCNNCFYLAKKASVNSAKSTSQYQSGEVAYLLQKWVETNRDSLSKLNIAMSDWGQIIGTDSFPVFSSDAVYAFTNCSAVLSYTNDMSLNGTTQDHDYSDTIDSENPKVDGLLALVCKHNHEHVSDIRVVKNFDGKNNLNLKYESGMGYTNDLYVEQLSLTDGDDLSVPIAFTAKEINYSRLSEKDTMTIIFPCDVPLESVNGIVYQLTSFDGKNLTYKKVTDYMHANTPYLIYKKRDSDDKGKKLISTLTNVTVYSTKDTVEINCDDATQFGSYGHDTLKVGKYDYYGYGNGKFLKAKSDIYLSQFRAAIRLLNPNFKSASLNDELNIVLGDGNTVSGMDVIDAVSEFGDKVNVFDVAGRVIRLNVPIENALQGLQNGIYIVNGKKVLVSDN